MVHRIHNLSENNSLMLFGARGCGKSTLMERLYSGPTTLWIDLLRAEDEELYRRDPDELSRRIEGIKPRRVVIDEVQKIPKLLDIVHREMVRLPQLQFILTGSSARKLRRGSANLLAGRAFSYQLYPLTSWELNERFQLDEALMFGSLPRLLHLASPMEKSEYLRSYARTYLREEILQEQLIRNLDPFQNFLEIAASTSGTILSYSKQAQDLGIDDKTVRNYYDILVDTYMGFYLEPFARSVRKRQRSSPKFYMFDLGVKRALQRQFNVPLVPKTYGYGEAFETWVIQECIRLNEYGRHDFRFSYLRTQNDVEIDLIIERPGQPEVLLEIKSTERIQNQHLSSLIRLGRDWDRPHESQVWSLDPHPKTWDGVECMHWTFGLKRIFDRSSGD